MGDKTETSLILRRVMRGLLALCAIGLLGEVLIHRHAYFALEATPFFFALFGVIAACLIIGGGMVAVRLIGRAPDYYGDDDDA
jgi:hypothetical protein